MSELIRRINGEPWTIIVVNSKQMAKQKKGPSLAGLCVPEEKTIYIHNECVDYKTVSHELVHAYFDSLHLADTNDMTLDDVEEVIASWFSSKADKVVRQAKKVVKDLNKLMEQDRE
jgi:hypothetical protein